MRRAKEIGQLGLSPEMGVVLLRVLANSGVKYMGQLHPPSAAAAVSARRALHAVFHLPHRGFSTKILLNLPAVGLSDCITADREATLVALSAARRLGDFALGCRFGLEEGFSIGDFTPLAHLLEERKPVALRQYVPSGWSSPDLALFVRNSASSERTLRGQGGILLRGRRLARAAFPLEGDAAIAKELGRRIRLWMPARYRDAIVDQRICAFLPVVRRAAKRDIIGWLRLLQNSFCTRQRFTGIYDACCACGAAASGRLRHIIECRKFWQPIFRAFEQAGIRTGIAELLLGDRAIERAGVAFRAHAMARHNTEIIWQRAVAAATR